MSENGWGEYKLLVMNELERIDDVVTAHLTKCDESIDKLSQSVAGIHLKLLKEIGSLKDIVQDKNEDIHKRLSIVENKTGVIYKIAAFSGAAIGIIIAIAEFVMRLI